MAFREKKMQATKKADPAFVSLAFHIAIFVATILNKGIREKLILRHLLSLF